MSSLRKYSIEIAAALVLLMIITAAWLGEFYQASEQVRQEVLRLHILAASDNEEDQKLKLAVRDRLLKESELWFSDESNKVAAEEWLQGRLKDIAAIAEDELKRHGCDDEVGVQLCRAAFSTRVYDTFTLPVGEYDALRIIIGEGEGQNWWCVLFPNLCLPSSGSEDWFVEHNLQVLQTTPQLEPRFALLEWLQNMKNS